MSTSVQDDDDSLGVVVAQSQFIDALGVQLKETLVDELADGVVVLVRLVAQTKHLQQPPRNIIISGHLSLSTCTHTYM